MATGGDRFSDPEYINWLRATLALMYMKEGLEEFTDNQADLFHKKLLKSFGKGKAKQSCKGLCSSTDIKKDFRNRIWNMSCSFCDSWLQSAISFHRNAPFPNMAPANTHPKLWQTEPWENMKLFVPFGSERDKCASDADIQGILSLFINCRHFSNGVHIGRQDLLDKLLGIRNSLLHSANFKVSQTDVKDHFQTVLSFMQGMTGLTGSEKDTLQTAIEKVQQLEANQIEISVNKELELRALKERQVALDRDLRALVDATQKEQDTQLTTVKQHGETLKQLKTTKEQFDEFLEKNDLVIDVSKLSKMLGDIDRTVAQHTKMMGDTDQTVAQHAEKMVDIDQTVAKLSGRLGEIDYTFGLHAERMEDMDQTVAQQAEMILNIDKNITQHTESLRDIDQTVAQHAERIEDIDQTVVQSAKRIGNSNQTFTQHDEKTGDIAQHIKMLHTSDEQKQSNMYAHTGNANDLEKQCKVLQQHLLHMYRKMKFWENPVSSEEVFLSQMYVTPSVKFIREINDRGMLAEVSKEEPELSKLTLETLFSSNTEQCENIYLTGDAGKGKTTFCNHLLLQWCYAVQNISNETVSTDILKELASFRFLFHINLRDTDTTYHVEDMIQEHLLCNLQMPLNLSDILKTERCLIVLDGLDEWSCPENVKKCPDINKHIPGRNTANTNCVFLTTTRTWKYDVIELKNKDVDKHIELSGIDAHSSEELAQKVMDNLDKKSITRKQTDDFYESVRQKRLDDFLTVPVLLIQLLTLWHAGKDLGHSQLQLYCSMLELFFERSEKNLPAQISKWSSISVIGPKTLPECFRTKYNCQTYAELLHCLAKLAYKGLFNKQKEESLVFKSSRLDIFGISPADIKLCLHCGILSQSKDYGNYTGKYKKLSFLHKKVQEFLAALFLVSNDTDEDILKDVQQFCNSVETVLEMNQVWLFVAGMESAMTRRLFDHFGNIVSSDDRVKTYRQSKNSARLIEDIQSCLSDCVTEGINNGHYYKNLCSEDFRVERDTIPIAERLLFCSDMSKVKSVHIFTNDMDTAKVAAITGQLQQCGSLQKLYMNDALLFSSIITDGTVAALIKNNCDSLTSLHWFTKITASDKTVTAICSSISKSLMALTLDGVNLTHEHTEKILHSLSQSPAMRHLSLHELNCIDHGDECRARMDWSAMTQLQTLTLWSMYVDNLQSLSHCLEKVNLWNVTLPVTSLRDFARGLAKTRRQVTVDLFMVTFTETKVECRDLKDFLRSCPRLVLTHCERNNRWGINFHTSCQ